MYFIAVVTRPVLHLSRRRKALFTTLRAALCRITVAGAFLIASSFSVSVFGQGGASITGHVTDPNGANVAGAEVRLHIRSGVRLFARTNRDGVYAFTGLGSGEYLLEVTASGFSTVTGRSVELQSGQTLTSDFQLNVASLNETVVVVSTGTPQRVDEVSKAVSVIEAQEIEARRRLSITDVLRGTPGLRVQQQGSPGALATWRLRGLRSYDTSVLLDGLRVRDASDINGSAVPLLTDLAPIEFDRVEILRGSGSSIYGTNAIGGVVNLVPGAGSGCAAF